MGEMREIRGIGVIWGATVTELDSIVVDGDGDFVG